MTTTLEERFGAGEAEFVRAEIARIPHDEYECQDNERLALEGDPEQVAAYEEQQREGCCGSFDARLGPSPAGRFYLFGFNHGH